LRWVPHLSTVARRANHFWKTWTVMLLAADITYYFLVYRPLWLHITPPNHFLHHPLVLLKSRILVIILL
jgi:hypothetical protein